MAANSAPASSTQSSQPPSMITSTRQTRPMPRNSAMAPSSGTATPTTGSATQTLTTNSPRATSPASSDDPNGAPSLVLRLRGAHDPTQIRRRQKRRQVQTQTTEATEQDEDTATGGPRIRWAESVIDNEGLGRKSSKVCCIYHKPRPVGESSSEDDSSSSGSEGESGSGSADDGGARMVGGGKGRKGRRGHKHGKGDDGCGHDHGEGGVGKKRKPSPNAYERMPKYGPAGGKS